ncbi:hypothetical protein GCM10023263_33520 [Phytohabitans rumicis]
MLPPLGMSMTWTSARHGRGGMEAFLIQFGGVIAIDADMLAAKAGHGPAVPAGSRTILRRRSAD